MKSNLPFLTYLGAFFASHASCAPQGTYDGSFHVSPGQTCTVEGGIKGEYLMALGDIKKSCDGLAFDPNSYSTTSDLWEMRCWFKQKCSKNDVVGLCLNKDCLSESQKQNWSKDTTCPRSASGIGCYVEQPASSTGQSLDKQAFSSTDSIIADSATTTPSFQIAGLPIIFDDPDSSSSTSTSASPESEYLLGQKNPGQEGDYSLTNNNMPNAGTFGSS